jgi:hypothetical protein
MRVTRVIAGLTAAVTVVLGLGLATADPAAAATSGFWHAYGNTNPISSSSSTWGCRSTYTDSSGVGAQVCTVRSSNREGVQAAVIVRNNRSTSFDAEAGMSMFSAVTGKEVNVGWTCAPSGVAPHSWSVCFGSTFTWLSTVYTNGSMDSVFLGSSPLI